MKSRHWLSIMFAMTAGVSISAAQCSDAGVCSIGHRAPESHTEIRFDYGFGRNSKIDNLTFHSFSVSGVIPVSESTLLTVILPYSIQSGPLGTVSGVGDLTAIWTHTVFSGDDSRINLNIGGKLSLADVNARNLPQAYQSGLGTNDVLAGIAYQESQWNFSLGYQLSRGRSDNTFSRLRRGDDLLLTAGYALKTGDVELGAEILAIKRLHQSSVLVFVTAQGPSYTDLPKSDQTQVNLVGRAVYPLTETLLLRGILALPALKRDVNVDGLTRTLSLSIGVTSLL